MTASMDNTARLWDAKTGAALATLSGHTDWVHSAAFSPDGTRVVTASADKTARLWDAKTGARARNAVEGIRMGSWSAAFSPDGSRVVTASDGQDRAAVGRQERRAHSRRWRGTRRRCRSAAFSPDGTRVVTASADKTARLWDAKSGAPLGNALGTYSWVKSAAFSPDGTRVVTASDDKTARLWDAKTGAALATLEGHTGNGQERGVQPGRHARRHRVRGQDRAAVGRQDRRRARNARRGTEGR